MLNADKARSITKATNKMMKQLRKRANRGIRRAARAGSHDYILNYSIEYFHGLTQKDVRVLVRELEEKGYRVCNNYFVADLIIFW